MLSKLLGTDLKASFNSEIKNSKICKPVSMPPSNGWLTIKKNSATKIHERNQFYFESKVVVLLLICINWNLRISFNELSVNFNSKPLSIFNLLVNKWQILLWKTSKKKKRALKLWNVSAIDLIKISFWIHFFSLSIGGSANSSRLFPPLLLIYEK